MATYGYTKEDLQETHIEPSKHSSMESLRYMFRKGEYSGRMWMLMHRYLRRFDRLSYKFLRFCNNEALLPTILIYPVFNLIFKKKIKLNVQLFSSRASDHVLSIYGRQFCLVGNSEQFEHQFLDERKVLIEKTVYLH